MKRHETARPRVCEPSTEPRRNTASTLYLITGLGALTTAVGLMLCGRHNRALLVAQWVAPLLLTAANERIVSRNEVILNR